MLRPLAMFGAVALLSAGSYASHPGCPDGNCQAQPQAHGWTEVSGCPTCQGYGGYCNNGSCHGGQCSLCQSKAWPDKGWNPPVRYPVQRDGIWYRNMWPQAWYGNRGGGFIGGAPMVYQPTDTTQLGYSYAKVPTWQQRPGMIPGTPFPPNFHSRTCMPRPCYGRLFDGYPNPGMAPGGCPTCQQNMVYQPHAAPLQATPMTPVHPPAAPATPSVPVPQSVDPAPAPPAPSAPTAMVRPAARRGKIQQVSGSMMSRLKNLFD